MRMFDMKDFGGAVRILGMRLRQEHDKIILNERKYIEKDLQQFNMTDCKPISTPLQRGIKYENGGQNDPESMYRSLI